MKTVKFKDLPEKVREFCNRIGYAWIGNIVDTEWLHTKADWSKATDEERLAYAEWRYKKGISYIPIRGGVVSVVSNGEMLVFNNKCVHESLNGESIINEADYYNLVYDGKWAEIISEPEKEEPTFKAGDEVTLDGSDANTVYNIIHIQDGMVWIKTEGMMFGRLVMLYRLRKPDPDKVYREIAKEIMKRYMLVELFPDKIESMLIEAIKKGKEL